MLDFHIHTARCGHASGNPRQYIEQALSLGLQVIGFSDHAPLPEHLRDGITMSPDETEHYIAEISSLRNEHQDKLDIRIGFEVDFPLHESFDRQYLVDQRLDYLIGSCHYLGEWPMDHPDHMNGYDERGTNNVYRQYYDCLLAMVETGYFNIVGHFDLVKKFGHRSSDNHEHQIARLARAVETHNMAVEINTSGLRKPIGEMYPSREILEVLFAHNTPITLGSDAHTPREVGADFDKALDLLREIGYRKISAFRNRTRYEVAI